MSIVAIEKFSAMLGLNPSRRSIFRKASSAASAGVLASFLACLLPGLGFTVASEAETAAEIVKTEQKVEAISRRTILKNTKFVLLLRVARRSNRGRLPLRPNDRHERHSLPNGLRAPLLC